MNYIIRSMNGKYVLFLHTGVGKDMVSSYLYDGGKIKTFSEEHHAIEKGDAVILRHEFGSCTCEPVFMRAIKK